MNYEAFLSRKGQSATASGFDPLFVPDWLFPFQRSLVEWAIRQGRAAIFADCGLGKTPMQLVWAENVVRKTNQPVLILTPLAVGPQTGREATKFHIEAHRSQDGKHRGGIVITNYERLHYFEPTDFAGVVCDESSILKSFSGATRKRITRFMSKMQYRLLCTATAAPNDYVELGTSAEALGELSYSDMLRRFFQMLDDKGQKKETKQQDEAERLMEVDPNYFRKLAYRVAQTIGQWRLKHHAVVPFWRWVASWARACRMPSDLGYDNNGFVLPPLNETDHIVKVNKPPPGMLFNVPAFGMGEERAERRRTMQERCEFVASLVNHDQPALIWCHMNQEGDLLEELIPNALQIAGRHSDDYKMTVVEWFIGEKCLCTDVAFRAKLATWQKTQRDPLDTTLKYIESIVSNALKNRRNTLAPIGTNESDTSPCTTNRTRTSTKKRQSRTLNGNEKYGSDTEPILSLEPSAFRKLMNTERESPTSELLVPCESTDQALKSIVGLPRWDALSAEQQSLAIQEVRDFTLTTITQPESFEGYSVLTAILGSENLEMIRNAWRGRQCICGHKSGNRKLISKAKIFGFGCNFQHCAHVVTLASHSYEQYYQSVRRCWRFGQKRPVQLDVVATEGELRVLGNMRKKAEKADAMFEALVREMNNATRVERTNIYTKEMEAPQWLFSTKP